MKYILENAEDRQPFLDEWQQRFIEAQLITLFRTYEDIPEAMFCSDEAIVLRTTAGDLAILVDTAGARFETGTFEIVPGETHRNFWCVSNPAWQEWQLEPVCGTYLGELRLYDTTFLLNGYTYCSKVAIQVGRDNWLILEDRADRMFISVAKDIPNEALKYIR